MLIPVSVKLYIYEVLFFEDSQIRDTFIKSTESERFNFCSVHSDVVCEYFEACSIDSLECYILNNFDQKFFYINSRCEYSRTVNF